MAYETILVEKKGIATVITLNRPEKLNAMNGQMLGEITQALAQLRQPTATRFVILTGALLAVGFFALAAFVVASVCFVGFTGHARCLPNECELPDSLSADCSVYRGQV